jgi:hypothetical protein
MVVEVLRQVGRGFAAMAPRDLNRCGAPACAKSSSCRLGFEFSSLLWCTCFGGSLPCRMSSSPSNCCNEPWACLEASGKASSA